MPKMNKAEWRRGWSLSDYHDLKMILAAHPDSYVDVRYESRGVRGALAGSASVVPLGAIERRGGGKRAPEPSRLVERITISYQRGGKK